MQKTNANFLLSHLVTGSRPLQVRLVDHLRRAEFTVSLVFFQGGHIQVLFPAYPLIMMDPGCDVTRTAGKVILFAGVFMGEVD